MEIWGWAVKLYGHIYIMYETFIFATRIVELNTAIQNLWLRYYFSMTQQSLLDQVLLIIVASLSNSDTPHSVGLLWTSGQPDAEASTWQYTTITRDSHPCPGGIRTYKPSKRPQTHALTLLVLMWRIGWAHNNARKKRIGRWDVFVTVHPWYNYINNQLDATITVY